MTCGAWLKYKGPVPVAPQPGQTISKGGRETTFGVEPLRRLLFSFIFTV